MSRSFGRTVQHILLVLSGGIGLITVLYRPIQHANDLWWHLADGRQIAQTHRIPHVDTFSFTEYGKPWVDHEWLYDLFAFKLFHAGNLSALIAFKIFLLLAALGAVWYRLALAGTEPWLCWGTCTVIAWAGRYAWSERPDLISFACLAWLQLFLDRLERSSASTGWWSLSILMFALWANLHGGFALGLLILALSGGAALIDSPKSIRSWTLGMSLCALATLLNPYGIRLAARLWNVMRRVQVGRIGDWMPTPWHPMEAFWFCLLFFWTALWVHTVFERRVRWRILSSGFVLSYVAVSHVRNVPYFLFAALPSVIPLFKQRLSRRSNGKGMKLEKLGMPLALAACIFLIARNAFHMRAGVDRKNFPIEACGFIAQENIPGLFYNDYRFGSYWIWRLGPEHRVFIDGRFEAVEGYVDLDRRIIDAKKSSPESWSNFLQSYHVTAALMQYPESTALPSVYRAYFPRDHWALVYWDDVALIFVRRLPPFERLIRRCEFPTVDPDADIGYVQTRLAQSATYRSAWREDVRRNAALHPGSKVVELWSTLANEPPADALNDKHHVEQPL